MDFISILIYLSIYLGLISTVFYVLSFMAEERKDKLLYKDSELPKVSVVIPAYNEESTIAKTLRSIIRTRYPDFEVLVVDDGSKDKTLSIAKRFAGQKVKVLHKKNGGKASALNFGIRRAKGKIIFTMDADTTVDPGSMKKMVRFFKDPEVMSVTPAMVTEHPRTIVQRVQYTEYAMGLFLRKAFAALRSIYIAPGAFSAYRKAFFDKYGLYDEHNITEDLEMGLRIQYLGFHTENCPEAPAYTAAPATFRELLLQRRRWYVGQVENLIRYRKIISRKFGDLGAFVIPTAMLSSLFTVMITIYLMYKIITTISDNFVFFQNINFNLGSSVDFSFHAVERVLFLLFTQPSILFTLLFMGIFGFYTYYASKKLGKPPLMFLNWILFFMLFAFFYGIWWIYSLFYSITRKSVKWK